MNVTFYKNFSKKFNSTKRPTGAGFSHTVRMKKECSVSKPTFLIDGVELDYNYCVFNNRYYFITDILLNNDNIYEISCNIDILATYKPYITSYNAFVERSASNRDVFLKDDAISVSGEIVNFKKASTSVAGLTFNNAGMYIFPVMNAYGVELFATQHIEDFGSLFQSGTYAGTNWWANGISAIMDMNKYFGKVIWVPYTIQSYGGSSVTTVTAGDPISVGPLVWFLAHDCYKISDLKHIEQNLGVYKINKPVLAYNDFRDMSREWTEFVLHLPGVGKVKVDPSIVGNPDVELLHYVTFAPATGDIKYRIDAVKGYNTQTETHSLFGEYFGNLAYTIPWGDNQWMIEEAIANASNIAEDIGHGGRYGGYVGAILSGIGNIARTVVDTFSSTQVSVQQPSGSLPSVITDLDIVLSVTQFGSADTPNTVNGRPLFRNTNIGSLSGYVKCGNASLDIAGFEDEKKILNNFLNSGFYYE